MQRPLDRFVVQETWPAAHRLAHGPWTAARAPFGRDAAAHDVVDPAQELVLLVVRHQIVEEAQHEPHRPHQVQDLAEADAQHGDVPRRRAARWVASSALARISAAISCAAVSTV